MQKKERRDTDELDVAKHLVFGNETLFPLFCVEWTISLKRWKIKKILPFGNFGAYKTSKHSTGRT